MLQKKLSKKKLFRIVRYLFFFNFSIKRQNNIINRSPSVFNSKHNHTNNRKLYKKLAFLGLSLSILSNTKFYSPTMKSLIYSVWDSVKTNTFII